MNAIGRVRESRDSGMTLTELLVAMGIFMAVLAVFMGAVVSMSQTTVRAQVTSDTTSQIRTTFQRFDKEIRYASEINFPGVSGGDYYVEYLVPVSTGNSQPLCVQWRIDTSERELQRRTWHPDTPEAATAWATTITNVRNDFSDPADRPFRFEPAGVQGSKVFTRQRLDVYIDAGMGEPGDGRGGQLDVSFAALNTSAASVTNSGTATVCLGGGTQRP